MSRDFEAPAEGGAAMTACEALVAESGIPARLARAELDDDLGLGSTLGLAALARLGTVAMVFSCDTARGVSLAAQAVRRAATHGCGSWCRPFEDLCAQLRPSDPSADAAMCRMLSCDLLCLYGVGADELTPWRVSAALSGPLSVRRELGMPSLVCTPLAGLRELLEAAAEAGCGESDLDALAAVAARSILLDATGEDGAYHGTRNDR